MMRREIKEIQACFAANWRAAVNMTQSAPVRETRAHAKSITQRSRPYPARRAFVPLNRHFVYSATEIGRHCAQV